MNMLVLVLFAVGCLHNTAANSIYESTGMAAAETILNDMNSVMSTTRLMNRASTQCWMESITTMSRWDAVSGSSYCASLSTEQQKILALELTNCQLLEENRPLFAHHHRDEKSMSLSSDHTSCPVGKNGSEPYEVSSCLRFMSDFALNLYHQMLLYANDMCNRLTHDVMEQQKEETTRMLMEASSSFIELTRKQQLEVDLAQKARERAMDEAITRNKLHLEEHQRQWEEVNHARQMEVARAQEVREKAAEAREREMEAREKAALLTMEEIVSQNMIHFQEQQQRWEELNLARAKEMHIVEERREQTEAIIKKQQYDMEKMQEIIATTKSQIQPLSNMHVYVKMVTSGFTFLKSILIFFVSMNTSWMVTAIPLLNRARRSLYVVFFIGFVLELLLVLLGENISPANDGANAIELVRLFTRVSAFITCFISFCMACIRTKKDPPIDVTSDELMKRQMEIVAMMQMQESNASAPVIMQSPHAFNGTTATDQQFSEESDEASRGDSFIISNPNFHPLRRQLSVSPYHPYYKPTLGACASPLASKKPITAAKPANRMVHTVTPNIVAKHDYNHHDIISHRKQHVQQPQSRAESSSDDMSEDSSDEDVQVEQLVMTKKKRKHAELQSSEVELNDSASSCQDQSNEKNETKKKKSKLDDIQVY